MPKPFPPWEIKKISQFKNRAEICRNQVPEYCWEWLMKKQGFSTKSSYIELYTDSPTYQDFARRVKYELDKQDTIFGEVEVPKQKRKPKAKWKDDVTEWEKENFGVVLSPEQEERIQNLLSSPTYPPYAIGYSPDGLKPERTATEISMIDADLRKQAEMMEALKATLDFVREKAVEKGYKPKPAKSEPVPTLKPKRKFQLDL